jgi:aryl-alcohol dehydrogenase-like predicted oxidoreductase
MNIILGSAQFGLDYGVTNNKGQVAQNSVIEIVQHAVSKGVHCIDTAYVYGDSERIVGNILHKLPELEVITKTRKFATLPPDVVRQAFTEGFDLSLQKLGLSKVFGFFIHDVLDLQRFPFLWDEMRRLKDAGLVEKIGMCIYNPEDLDIVFKCDGVDIVQLPLNVFDQRFLSCNALYELKHRSIEIHIRSLFLQGILLSDGEKMPAHFAPVRSTFTKYFSDLQRMHFSPMQGAVAFIKQLNELVDSIVLGFTAPYEIEEFFKVFSNSMSMGEDIDFKLYAINQEQYVSPLRWPSKNVFWGQL